MATLCPYCKDDLRVEMTAQFVDRVDESILAIYSEELERAQNRASAYGGMQGRMMKKAVGMSRDLQSKMMQMTVEYPPMITILKCMSCDAALSVKLPSSGSSS